MMEKPLPLAGFRVLDVSQVIAGPYCCMLLGDLGADVIKVEPPEGDQSRGWGFPMRGDDNTGFMALNRNKRSVVLDLKREDDLAAFYRLADTADVLVENTRPGVTKRLRIDAATVRARNPRLVYASISGFGQTGPWASRPGFDLVAQAMSGLMSVTGYPEAAPAKCGVPVADIGAALLATYAILSALLGREKTGEGQTIDTSLFEAALAFSIWEASEYWATGQAPDRIGTSSRMSAPYQAVRAADGYLVLGAGNQRLFAILCETVGRPALARDPRFTNNVERLKNLPALIGELEACFANDSVDAWVAKLLAAGVPAAPINDYAQALKSEHVQARDMILEIAHPVESMIKTLGFPVKLDATPAAVRRPPPLLGEHTREVLRELGIEREPASGTQQ